MMELRLDGPVFDGFLDAEMDRVGGRRFFQIVVGSESAGFHGAFHTALPREHDDDLIGPDFLDFLKRFDSVHPGHPNVQHHDVECLVLDFGQCLLAASCDCDVVVLQLQADLKALEQIGFVVDDKDVLF